MPEVTPEQIRVRIAAYETWRGLEHPRNGIMPRPADEVWDAVVYQTLLAAGVPQLLDAAKHASWLIGDDDGDGWGTCPREKLRRAIARTEAACQKR